MAVKRFVWTMNGDIRYKYWIYECDKCHEEIEEAWPYYKDPNDIRKDYCVDCSYKLGIINDKEYLSHHSWVSKKTKVRMNPETKEIEVTDHKRFSWEKTDGDCRKDHRYKVWRMSVFERDNFTCQGCCQVGGVLQAHHLNTFKDYKTLRYDVNNGVTLCKSCHLLIHQIKREEGKKPKSIGHG